ncbi:MAG TPA: alpha/beta fold hydrolase [Actinomycetota bacterium]|nr:alpha/beta fold hydrolase [Actinomycetota bacterium]
MSRDPAFIASRDGAAIARWTRGEGPPVVLVHGAASDHRAWARAESRLARAATVHSLDRRGHGRSGDAEPYAIEREFEDVAAVADELDRPTLVGHSFGATCALGAALVAQGVRALVLIEPGAPRRGRGDDDLAACLEEHLARGDRDEALAQFARAVVGTDPDELRAEVGERAWRVALDNVGTAPRELRAQSRVTWTERDLAAVRAPTVIVLGERSPVRYAEPARTLARLLPAARAVGVRGGGHRAALTDPDPLVALVRSALDASAGGAGGGR